MNFYVVFVINFLYISSCASYQYSAPIENNQYIYYGKSEKIQFITINEENTLKEISDKYSVPVNEIKRLNCFISYKKVTPGQILKVPLRQFYLVKYNENIREIAKIYDIHFQSLLKENNMSKEDRILPGQFIKIPENIRNYKKFKYIISKQTNILTQDFIAIKSNKNRTQFFKNLTPFNNKQYVWPLQGKVIKKYGNYNGKLNDGITITAIKGSNILATTDGQVIFTGYKPSNFGNLIIIQHKNNYMSAYSHCDTILVSKNQFVKKGDIIATCGLTGNVTQPQLQFTIKKGVHIIDPDN